MGSDETTDRKIIYLLDVNVLIALSDTTHSKSKTSMSFFENHAVWEGRATSPLTENGFLRILGNPNYPGGTGTSKEARRLLNTITSAPGHRFWPDDLSLATDDLIHELVASHLCLTDFYLLSLAVANKGKLATFDKRIDLSFVTGDDQTIFTLEALGE